MSQDPPEFPPLCGDLFLPLVDRLDDDELGQLRAAPILPPEQRVAITMLALGDSQHHVALDLDLGRPRLQELLRSAARRLRPPGGNAVPALVNAAYKYEVLPAPAPEKAKAPELKSAEWEVLHAHTIGLSLRSLQHSRGRRRHEVGTAHQYLLAKLRAHTTAHAVRRAWEFGIFGCVPHSIVPGASGSVARRMPWD
ncbi:hypothetical protein AB0K09_19070 [Streptomyces sp. NPDC049577]|uniref:hypothetical protein n=1 Tax=Streptomyces sp. NPDC049577 TaxID=3155153 RepID=UPI0034155091